MSEHKPIQELVMPMDCVYGECDHDDTDDCSVTMTVCDTCREVIEFEEWESFVLWPCEHESRRLLEQTIILPAPAVPGGESNG